MTECIQHGGPLGGAYCGPVCDELTRQDTAARASGDIKPCFGCGHVHDPASQGACWEADCLPSCPEH